MTEKESIFDFQAIRLLQSLDLSGSSLTETASPPLYWCIKIEGVQPWNPCPSHRGLMKLSCSQKGGLKPEMVTTSAYPHNSMEQRSAARRHREALVPLHVILLHND